MLNIKDAIDFVNSHAPISAQALIIDGIPQKLYILGEEVDRYGHTRNTMDTIECENGKVSQDKIRDVLGY